MGGNIKQRDICIGMIIKKHKIANTNQDRQLEYNIVSMPQTHQYQNSFDKKRKKAVYSLIKT